MTQGIKVLSLFDGMACGYEALKRAGIKVAEYHAFEIDKYAIQVAKKNHPDIIHHGSVIGADFTEFLGIDLLIGGSPCQGFSFAGKQLAFDDPRSALFFEFSRALHEAKPWHFLLENVKMLQEHLDVITSYMGVAPLLINSALVSAQNRQRFYWCNWEINQPEDKNITWGMVREYGEDSQCYYYTENALNWLAQHSHRHHKILRIHNPDEKMQMLEASHHKKYSAQRFFGIIAMPADQQKVAAMRGRYLVNGKRQDGKQLTSGLTQQYIEFRYDSKTNALTTVGKDNVVVPFTLPNRVPVDDFFFRYITPIECERLQTLPDNYTAGVSDTQRYKMLGNGWTVDVIAHLFRESPYATA